MNLRRTKQTCSRAALLSEGLLALFFPFAAGEALQASVIVNGSFESPVVNPNQSPQYNNYPAGTDLGGWKVVGIDSAIVRGTFMQSGITFQAQDGNQWIDLAGVNSNSMLSGVTQDIPTTIGQQYEVSFYVGSATDGRFFFPTTVDLSINGGARTSYTNPNAPTTMLDWMEFIVPFTATSATTNLTFFNGDAPNNYNTSLDNVSVEIANGTVPEATGVVVWSLLVLVSTVFVWLRR